MRFLGLLAAVAGAAVVAYAIREVYRRSRPADVGFAVLAFAGAALALIGLATVAVPAFLTG